MTTPSRPDLAARVRALADGWLSYARDAAELGVDPPMMTWATAAQHLRALLDDPEPHPAAEPGDVEALAGRVTVVSWEEHLRLCALAVAREHTRLAHHDAEVAARARAELIDALDPCGGGEEQHSRHVDVCVPFQDRAAALLDDDTLDALDRLRADREATR